MTDHVTDVELRRFAGGQFRADDLLRADDHLPQCEGCRSRAAAVNDAAANIRSLGAQLSEPEMHVSDDELQLFVERRLPAGAREIVERHLRACAVCAAQVDELRPWASAGTRRTLYAAAMAAIILLAIVIPATMWQTRSHTPTTARSLAGLETLPPAEQAAVQAALATGTAELPAFMADLAQRRETLMGGPAEHIGRFELIAPVGTGTITDTPVFEWNPFAGAEGYVVTVADERSNVVFRSRIVTATKWIPASSLPRGRTYVWQVAALRGGSTVTAPAPPAPPAIFRVIDADDAEILQRTARGYPASHLLLGILDMRAGMRDEAIKHFEEVPSDNPHAQLARRSVERLRAIDGRQNGRLER